MRSELIIADNPLLPDTWQRITTDDVLVSLRDYYGEKFPQYARLYFDNVAVENDITPKTEEDIQELQNKPGRYYAVNYPKDPLTLIAIAIVALVAIAAIALKPKVPTASQRKVDDSSPNNALSGRSNSIRLNGRIPDIFGTVRSTPDLIAVPYTVFENNLEIEYCYMAIGRGTYAVDAATCRDGQTPCSQITGESLEIFKPYTSPNKPGAGPQLRIGDAISKRVIAAIRSKSVNGQTLLASNEDVYTDAGRNYTIRYPDIIATVIPGDPGFIFTDHIQPGDDFSVSMGNVDAGIQNYYPIDYGSEGGIGNKGLFGLNFEPSDITCRFHSNGQIEFQSITDIGTDRRMNQDGYGFLVLSNAAVTDGPHTADVSGKYVVSIIDSSTLQAINADNSSAGWSELAAFAGAVSPWVTATFLFPVNATVNLSGNYTAAAVNVDNVHLVTPDNFRENNDWVWLLHSGPYNQAYDVPAVLAPPDDGATWIGPFVIDSVTSTDFFSNFVALQGMYKDDGTTQKAVSVTVQLGITPCTAGGIATGDERSFLLTLTGSDTKRSTVGATLYSETLPPGRYMVRARRLTPKDHDFVGQISDEVKWRDLYGSSEVGNIDFGDLTTVHCRTVGTQEALAVSERQINMLVTRKIPIRVTGGAFSTDLHATNDAAEILSFICLDPKLGNRPIEEINFDNFYDTVEDIKAYFGVDSAAEFCYTFDSDNLSAEETIATVAGAIFCQAQRRGNVIELNFEKKTTNSRLLFNHRNKVPNSETRTFNFGNVDDNDGIEYQYVSPLDDAIVTLYLPEDRSAVKPIKIESIGVRNAEQAYLHAWREYNRLRFRHTAIEFEATQEAEVLGRGDRILVADNSRPDVQDGEIDSQDGLVLKLSQPAVLKPDSEYIISLQLASGLVQNIGIVKGDDDYHVILEGPPSEALSLDDEAFVKTVYQIVRNDELGRNACIVTEKTYPSGFTVGVQAINYDDRYYDNDQEFA